MVPSNIALFWLIWYGLTQYQDKKGEEDSESGIVEIEDIASSSSSPTLSRPPTPVLTTPVKPHVVAGRYLHCLLVIMNPLA